MANVGPALTTDTTEDGWSRRTWSDGLVQMWPPHVDPLWSQGFVCNHPNPSGSSAADLGDGGKWYVCTDYTAGRPTSPVFPTCEAAQVALLMLNATRRDK